ncbi:hypothetical protein JCM8547_005680 [Rhodosporidiobolus lusitaniae]
MPAPAPYMSKFTEQGGDAYLAQAMEEIPVQPGEANAQVYHLADGSLVSYTNALAAAMNSAAQGTVPEVTAVEVRDRLRALDKKLGYAGEFKKEWSDQQKTQARINGLRPSTLRPALPEPLEPNAYAAGPSTSYGYHSQHHEGEYAGDYENYEYPETVQPPYSGPSGPGNPFRSLGHGRFSPSARTVPLPHAVIYGGEGRRRF